jgi:hypothetical protein
VHGGSVDGLAEFVSDWRPGKEDMPQLRDGCSDASRIWRLLVAPHQSDDHFGSHDRQDVHSR